MHTRPHAHTPRQHNITKGGTDSSNYADLLPTTGSGGGGVLRFVPRAASGAEDAHRVHGTDERVSVASFTGAYCTFLRGLRLFGEHRGDESGGSGSGDGGGGGGGGGSGSGFGGRRVQLGGPAVAEAGTAQV